MSEQRSLKLRALVGYAGGRSPVTVIAGGEGVLLAVRLDGVVVALTAEQAKYEHGMGRLSGWMPLDGVGEPDA